MRTTEFIRLAITSILLGAIAFAAETDFPENVKSHWLSEKPADEF